MTTNKERGSLEEESHLAQVSVCICVYLCVKSPSSGGCVYLCVKSPSSVSVCVFMCEVT